MAYIEIFGPSVGGAEITGTGAANQLAYFTGPNVIASGTDLTYVATSGRIGYGGSSTFGWEAANVLSQRNGVNAQGLNIYNTYTSASNYEGAQLGWTLAGANIFSIRTIAATGSLRNIAITAGSGTTHIFSTDGSLTNSDDNNAALGDATHRYSNIFSALGTFGVATARSGDLYIGANADSTVFYDNAGGKTTLVFKRTGGTLASPSDVTNTQNLGRLLWRAYSAGTFDVAEVDVGVEGTWSSGQAPGTNYSISTRIPNGALTTALTLDSTQKATFGGNITGVSNVLSIANGSNTQHLRIYGSEALSRYLDISCDATSITFQSAASVTAYFFGLNGTYSLIYDGNGIYPNTDNTAAVGITSKRYAAGNFVTLNTNTVAGTAGSLTLNPFSTNPVFITTSLQVGVVTNGTGSFYEGSDTNVDNRWDSASATATAATSLSFRRAKGSQATRTIVASGDRVGLIEFDGWNGTSYDSAVVLRAIIDQTPGASGDMPGRFEILTTPDGSATPTIALTVDRAQNIGLMNNLAFNGATGHISVYENISTVGFGVPAIFAAGRLTAQTAAQASVSTYTVGAADGSFEVSVNVNVTTSTAHTFTVTIAYTDEGNTSRTLTAGFTQLSGATFLTAITNVTGAGPYESPVYHIRCKAATTITVATVGTFTTVTYNVEGIIKQMA